MSRSTPTPAQGRSNQACKRCHARKKRCDRALPKCGGCCLANELCSFQDRPEESGVFLVSYVRGLEARVRQLENQEQRPLSTDPDRPDGDNNASSPAGSTYVTGDTTGVSLENQLKGLSLEATAERYLGSSSGLSFARLTTAVLKRLKPDQYAFTIESTQTSVDPDESIAKYDTTRPDMYSNEGLDLRSIISEERADYLADCYWSHSHTLYPFLNKVAFNESIRRMYSQPDDADLTSRSWLYTMWMVLAIGSTARSSVMVEDEVESVAYFERAMEHLDGALNFGSIAALSAILLQVSYSFFNKVGPNTWHLVGVGVRIAIGIGLHTAPSQAVQNLPLDDQEYRKRLFFSLYMMDRLVSVSLGRPFGIQDHDVEIETFASVDDENILPNEILPQSQLRPSAIAVPLHILTLRRICGKIFEQIYSNRNRHLSPPERDNILQDLHQELIEWRRGMPFPLPQSKSLPIPQFSTAWYDLNYYQHVLMLYRPSPLFPVLTLEKVSVIAEASSMFVSQVAILQREGRYAFNWLNLFNVFTATLTLIYSITAQPEPLPVYLQRTNALNDLQTVTGLLDIFARKFPSALKCRHIVEGIMGKLEAQVGQRVTPTTIMQTQPAVSSHAAREGRDDAGFDSAWPTFNTGNTPYDNLQQQVSSLGSPLLQTSDFDAELFPSESTGPGFNDLLTAAGLGTSADTDMDEEMLQLFGATTDAWG